MSWFRAALIWVRCSFAFSASASASAPTSASAFASLSCSCGLIPTVIDKVGEFDIFTRLFKDRIICIDGPISDDTASIVVAQLLYLESDKPSKPVHLYINSLGGDVTAGLAIYDTIRYIKSPVATLCIGQAISMASLLLAAGTPGKRRALLNSRVMIHQPSISTSGKATDVAIDAKEIFNLRDRLNGIYATHTGHSIWDIQRSMNGDKFMTAEEAKKFGIVDQIIHHRLKNQVINRRTRTRPIGF